MLGTHVFHATRITTFQQKIKRRRDAGATFAVHDFAAAAFRPHAARYNRVVMKIKRKWVIASAIWGCLVLGLIFYSYGNRTLAVIFDLGFVLCLDLLLLVPWINRRLPYCSWVTIKAQLVGALRDRFRLRRCPAPKKLFARSLTIVELLADWPSRTKQNVESTHWWA